MEFGKRNSLDFQLILCSKPGCKEIRNSIQAPRQGDWCPGDLRRELPGFDKITGTAFSSFLNVSTCPASSAFILSHILWSSQWEVLSALNIHQIYVGGVSLSMLSCYPIPSAWNVVPCSPPSSSWSFTTQLRCQFHWE